MTRPKSNDLSTAPAPMTPWPEIIEAMAGDAPGKDGDEAASAGAPAAPDKEWWPEYYQFLRSGVADLLGLAYTCPRRQCRTAGFCCYDRDRQPCRAALPRETPIVAAMLMRFVCRESDRIYPGWDEDLPGETELMAGADPDGAALDRWR